MIFILLSLTISFFLYMFFVLLSYHNDNYKYDKIYNILCNSFLIITVIQTVVILGFFLMLI